MAARIWLIAGPTASGKSALAQRLAQEIGGEIVGADSMQLYRDLRVLSARPTAEEEALVPHHLVGVADAADPWSVGRWLRAAREVLAGIGARGRPAVIVGGTGLYFRALTEGLADVPPVPQIAQAAAATLFDEQGEAAFRDRLRMLDPKAEARISPGDRQRLVRALAVAEATGRSLTDWQKGEAPLEPPSPLREGIGGGGADSMLGSGQPHPPTPSPQGGGGAPAFVLEPPREALYAACDGRLEAMLKQGALEEVRALLARDLDPQLPAMKAVGVREFSAHLRGETSLPDALAAAQRETRRYAKRQSTWFRNQTPEWPRIVDLNPSGQWNKLRAILTLP